MSDCWRERAELDQLQGDWLDAMWCRVVVLYIRLLDLRIHACAASEPCEIVTCSVPFQRRLVGPTRIGCELHRLVFSLHNKASSLGAVFNRCALQLKSMKRHCPHVDPPSKEEE